MLMYFLAILALQAAPPRETDGCPGPFVFFEPGSAQLGHQAVTLLERDWDGWIRGMVAAGAWLNIEGNADDLEAPSDELGLSERRADAVRAFLIARGAAPESLRVRAHGANRPLVEITSQQSAERDRAQNRYVQTWPEMRIELFRRFFPPGAPIC